VSFVASAGILKILESLPGEAVLVDSGLGVGLVFGPWRQHSGPRSLARHGCGANEGSLGS